MKKLISLAMATLMMICNFISVEAATASSSQSCSSKTATVIEKPNSAKIEVKLYMGIPCMSEAGMTGLCMRIQ